ncbi:methionine ABC transporter ATP-binding protein [Neoaquamicrobium microcysteis]|nr:methionine ABC transporter ATP-binding protein [Mesorhizobium microcysteis]
MNMAPRNAAPDTLHLEPVGLLQNPSGVPTDLVRLEGVSKVFPASKASAAVAALDGIDLSAAAGSITAIIGRSGAGKSTLIRLINGLEKPTTGRVMVGSTDVAALAETGLRDIRRSIGMIFQHFNLLSSRTVFDNVALPLEIAGTRRADIAKRVTPLLDLVGLADKRDRYPSELSGGQKQRVGIARALATRPALLLSDEATSALDPETTQSVLDLLKRINRELGLTILLITHEMEVVKRIADHVAVIDKGRIVERGSAFEIFSAPRHETTKVLLSGVPGMQIPDYVAARLTHEPSPASQTVMRVVFTGPHATDPVLSRLTGELGLELNILGGAVDEIAGEPFGTLLVSFPADAARLALMRSFLGQRGLKTEVLGYVA